ncbi:MAG TPA: hypothetical protein GX727_01475 [Clostridium sp.]|jgi:hypothetical protein|nr:hypothetical protein [Clostridium sp.]
MEPITGLFIGFLVYIYTIFCTLVIAYKLDIMSESGWLTWAIFVPGLNVLVLLHLADLSLFLFLLVFLPAMHKSLVVVVYLLVAFCYMRIFAFRGKHPLFGLLMFVPFVNLFVLGYVAFIDKEEPIDPLNLN